MLVDIRSRHAASARLRGSIPHRSAAFRCPGALQCAGADRRSDRARGATESILCQSQSSMLRGSRIVGLHGVGRGWPQRRTPLPRQWWSVDSGGHVNRRSNILVSQRHSPRGQRYRCCSRTEFMPGRRGRPKPTAASGVGGMQFPAADAPAIREGDNVRLTISARNVSDLGRAAFSAQSWSQFKTKKSGGPKPAAEVLHL